MNAVWKYIGAALIFVVAPSAQAATLMDVSGQVMINVGAGFQPAAASESLPAGTQVMASLTAKATIVYSESCSVAVAPGIVHTVAAKAPCTSEKTAATKSFACGGSMKDDDKCASGTGHAGSGSAAAAAAPAVPAAAVGALVVAGAAAGIAIYQSNRGNGRGRGGSP